MATVPATKRTTAPKRRAAKQTYDIDAELLEEFGEVDPDKVEVVEFGPIFGETFYLLKEVNLFNVSGLGDLEEDSAALQRYILSMVHPYGRAKFKNLMAREIAMDAKRLLFVMRRMTEAVADGNPTTMSSVSSRTSAKAGTKALSEVS